jgi:hypothetical protein
MLKQESVGECMLNHVMPLRADLEKVSRLMAGGFYYCAAVRDCQSQSLHCKIRICNLVK